MISLADGQRTRKRFLRLSYIILIKENKRRLADDKKYERKYCASR
jgi:hypothetical protein